MEVVLQGAEHLERRFVLEADPVCFVKRFVAATRSHENRDDAGDGGEDGRGVAASGECPSKVARGFFGFGESDARCIWAAEGRGEFFENIPPEEGVQLGSRDCAVANQGAEVADEQRLGADCDCQTIKGGEERVALIGGRLVDERAELVQ